MSYLVNTARASSLTVGGIDYTQNLVSWSCSDSSAVKNGLIATTGQLELGTIPGTSLEDYDRNKFKRGQRIVLDITYPDGTETRHPRGLLYVVGVSYSPESESLSIEMGCRIALAALTDEVSSLQGLPTVILDPARKDDYQNISSGLAAGGKAAYQDNTGSFQVVNFFGNDTEGNFDQGSWVSVVGQTALSASPLAGSSPIPDGIKLSYQVPVNVDDIVDEEDQANPDSPNKLQIDTTESYYFLTYPAVVYKRTGDGELPEDVSPGSTPSPTDSGCGNSPDQPGDNGQGSCNDNYVLTQTPLILPAYKIQSSRTEYKGPGGQVSYKYSEVRGPALEANDQYYADKFAYCRYTWATACQPNGGCDLDGQQEILLGYVTQSYAYNQSGEVISTTTDTYIPTLAAAQPFNWRSGVVNGAPQNFQTLSTSDMFRSQRRVEEYKKEGNTNVTESTLYTSITAQQSGISAGNIDALSGTKTREVRKSTTITGSSVLPDTVNAVETTTEERTQIIPLFSGSYVTPPPEAGPYYLEESVPVPVLLDTASAIENFVQKYGNVTAMFTKGDSLGVQVAESLRPEIASAWRPGCPFRYSDPSKNKLSAMRMDATSWSVTLNECLLVTSGLWVGFSNGTVTLPSNLVGNSTPSLGDGPVAPPPGAGGPPTVDDETNVSPGARGWVVDINIYTETPVITYGDNEGVNPPLPTDTNANIRSTFMCYVRGVMTEPGSLASVDGTGGIPVSLGGSLLLSGAVVVDADLFS